jgi:hypothetical protein
MLSMSSIEIKTKYRDDDSYGTHWPQGDDSIHLVDPLHDIQREGSYIHYAEKNLYDVRIFPLTFELKNGQTFYVLTYGQQNSYNNPYKIIELYETFEKKTFEKETFMNSIISYVNDIFIDPCFEQEKNDFIFETNFYLYKYLVDNNNLIKWDFVETYNYIKSTN